MKEARCRVCCGVLFQEISMDASGQLILKTEGPEIEWKSDGTRYYIGCPHCEAKNIAVRMNSSETPLELDIVAAVMEDE